MGFFLFGTFIPYYGFFIVIGIVCAFVLGFALCKKLELNTDDFILLCAELIAFGFVGAKVLYIMLSINQIDFAIVFSSMYNFNLFLGSGFIFYGGILGGLIALFFAQRIHGIRIDVYANVISPCVALAHAFGRIGCALVGCCYGKETSSFLSVMYKKSFIAPNEISLIPVQVIESLCLFFLVAILSFLLLRKKVKNVWLVYLFIYSILRFFLEFLRGDYIRGLYGVVSTSQIISLLIIIGIVLHRNLKSY